MTNVALYGKQQQPTADIPGYTLGCCKNEMGGRRQVIESTRDLLLPSLPPSGRYPVSCQDLDTKAAQKDVFDTVLFALHEEFKNLREAQTHSDKRLQEQMHTMDAKLNHMLQQKELISKLMHLAVDNELVERNGSRARSPSPRRSPRSVAHSPRSGRSRSVFQDSKMTFQVSEGNGQESPRADADQDGRPRPSSAAIVHMFSQKSKASQSAGEAVQEAVVYEDTTEAQVLQHRQQGKRDTVVHAEGVLCLARIVMNSYFDTFIAFAVVVNSILVGFQINHEASGAGDHGVYFKIECGFTGLFTLELIVRLVAAGRTFCMLSDPPILWPTFDTALVLLSWADLVLMVVDAGDGLPGPAASMAKLLKLARMARIMRFLRMTKLLAQVRVFADIIVGSMATLVWLFLLLMTIMYVFAIWLTQGASEWMGNMSDDHATYLPIKAKFGTVQDSMLTLFESVTGGISWGEPNKLAQEIGLAHSAVFCFFIFFFFFSVLNIVTGVYVDGALQQAHNDRTMQEMQKEKEKKAGVQLLSEALEQIDTDESGCISRAEWLDAMQSHSVRNIMELLAVDISDANKLFDLVDIDGDEALTITEFVDGMGKLRGGASSIDVHVIMCRLNHLISQIRHLFIEPEIDKYQYKVTRDSSVGQVFGQGSAAASTPWTAMFATGASSSPG